MAEIPTSDPFDKALALAKEFADREIASVHSSFDRFTNLIKWLGGVAIGIIGLFGIVTFRDAHRVAVASVKAEMPALVEAEVRRQFAPENVQRVAEKVLTVEVRTDIERIVDSHVSSAMTEEMRKQTPGIQREITRRSGVVFDELRPQIAAAAEAQAKALVAAQLAPRSLSAAQRAALIKALPKDGVRAIQIYTEQIPERIHYGQEIANAFRDAGWTVRFDSLIMGNTHAVYGGELAIGEKPGFSSAAELKRALELGGLPIAETEFGGGCMDGSKDCFVLKIWEKHP